MKIKSTLLVILFILISSTGHSQEDGKLLALFPTVSELPGGGNHWLSSVLPEEQVGSCKVYSGTYAYFANKAEKLFDIPRKMVYSVNIRFHVCNNSDNASKLYDKFSKVGDKDKKRLVGIGDKGVLYVVPSAKSALMGDYYLTSLFKYVVLQVHADDGFVLMDFTGMMGKRMEEYLSFGKSDVSQGFTVIISKDGFERTIDRVTFAGDKIGNIIFSGVLYDQHNSRVDNATIIVPESGKSVLTNSKGEFKIALPAGKGKDVAMFRTLAATKKTSDLELSSGYYKVDITFDASGKVGQDSWRLQVSPKDNKSGIIAGTSLNIADERSLSFTGTVQGDNITIDRPCGSSIMGVCNQKFTARLSGDIFEGKWQGTGGGGKWRLYTNSYEEKKIVVSTDEADLAITGKMHGKDSWGIASGKTHTFVTITPQKKAVDDFYLKSVKMKLGIVSTDNKSTGSALYILTPTDLNKDNKKYTKQGSSLPLYITPEPTVATVDITNIYKNSTYAKYLLGFDPADDKVYSVKVSPEVEMTFAIPVAKTASKGSVGGVIKSFDGADIAGGTTAIKPNRNPDVVIEMNISAFGSTLNAIEIKAYGKDKRSWNTQKDNIYPGVAVVSDGAVVNNPDGTLNFPFQNYDNVITLHIDRGSLKKDSIDYFEVILTVDQEKSTYTIYNK